MFIWDDFQSAQKCNHSRLAQHTQKQTRIGNKRGQSITYFKMEITDTDSHRNVIREQSYTKQDRRSFLKIDRLQSQVKKGNHESCSTTIRQEGSAYYKCLDFQFQSLLWIQQTKPSTVCLTVLRMGYTSQKLSLAAFGKLLWNDGYCKSSRRMCNVGDERIENPLYHMTLQ